MAVAAGLGHSPLPLPRSRRRGPLQLPTGGPRLPAGPPLLPPCRAAFTTPPPPPLGDDSEARKSRLDLALLLAAAVAADSRNAAIAASGGAMGGRSYSSSSRSSSSTPSSSSSSRSSSSFSSSSSSSYSSSSSWPRGSSPSSSLEQQAEATHVSVGTPAPPRVYTAAEREASLRFWGYLASASVSAVSLFLALRHYTRPRTTVVKLQVALLGLAKSFQKDLNEISEKMESSDQRWYKFILTETLCSLRRHNNCCISSSLSVRSILKLIGKKHIVCQKNVLVDVKDEDSWEQKFDKISIEERSKFDEETLYNLEEIKRKKAYSKKPDGFRNEYIVLTILIAADGALKFPDVRNYADLEAVVEKLNSIPARQIQGIQVLWTPQDENDVLSEGKLLEDYQHLKPLSDD